MHDYLKNLGKGWRILSALACTLAAAIFLLLVGLLCVDVRNHQGFHADNVGLAAVLFIMALLGFASSYLARRLWRGSVSENGVTSMPTWFIQAFGVFFLAGSVVVALAGGSRVYSVEGMFVALAMILVGRNIARRKTPRE